jgi:preprotein translocase subunit SecD
MRWTVFAPLILIAAAPADVLIVGNQRFPQSEIIDARAVGGATGPAVLVTLNPVAAKRFGRITQTMVGKPMVIAFGATRLSAPIIVEPVRSGSFEITGPFKNFAEAEAMAKRISGKPPLPESLDE